MASTGEHGRDSGIQAARENQADTVVVTTTPLYTMLPQSKHKECQNQVVVYELITFKQILENKYQKCVHEQTSLGCFAMGYGCLIMTIHGKVECQCSTAPHRSG